MWTGGLPAFTRARSSMFQFRHEKGNKKGARHAARVLRQKCVSWYSVLDTEIVVQRGSNRVRSICARVGCQLLTENRGRPADEHFSWKFCFCKKVEASALPGRSGVPAIFALFLFPLSAGKIKLSSMAFSDPKHHFQTFIIPDIL